MLGLFVLKIDNFLLLWDWFCLGRL